jgi:hypothetical protein
MNLSTSISARNTDDYDYDSSTSSSLLDIFGTEAIVSLASFLFK